MTHEKPIALARECQAVMIPSGETVTLPAGSQVWLTQALGGSFTAMTDHGHMVRIDGADAEMLGLADEGKFDAADRAGGTGGSVEERVWNQLRTCFDPEIPVNIVDLGLIYDCRAEALDDGGGHRVKVRFTLTAQGCGMGQFLKEDIRKKLLAVPGVREVDIDLVWDPPWNQSRISPEAKQRLGIE